MVYNSDASIAVPLYALGLIIGAAILYEYNEIVVKPYLDAKGKTFRGGKKKDRDNWGKYGKEKDFQRWWHRKGKKEWGGDDIEPEQLDDVYDDWVNQGKPKVK